MSLISKKIWDEEAAKHRAASAEHPAVALLRALQFFDAEHLSGEEGECIGCHALKSEGCDPDCRLAAILAGGGAGDSSVTKQLRAIDVATYEAAPSLGERVMQEVLDVALAKARAEGAAEERDRICVWMSDEWGTQESANTNDLIGEVVQNIRDGEHCRARKPTP